jgi:hypothetical protein
MLFEWKPIPRGRTSQLIHTSHAQYWQQRKSQTQAWREDAVH